MIRLAKILVIVIVFLNLQWLVRTMQFIVARILFDLQTKDRRGRDRYSTKIRNNRITNDGAITHECRWSGLKDVIEYLFDCIE